MIYNCLYNKFYFHAIYIYLLPYCKINMNHVKFFLNKKTFQILVFTLRHPVHSGCHTAKYGPPFTS